MRAIFLAVMASSVLSCTSITTLTRSEVALKGEPSQTQDGLTLDVRVLMTDAEAKHSRAFTEVKILSKAGSEREAAQWPPLRTPIFEVRVRNSTGHVVKMTGAVVRLLDGAGNVYEPVAKEDLADDLKAGIAAHERETDGLQVSGELQAALKAVKLLDDNAQFLPDIADTYFVSFQLPAGQSHSAIPRWITTQSVLWLKIHDVPIAVAESAAVVKRAAFEFPVEVKSFRETYEVALGGTKLLSRTEIEK